VPIGGKGSTWLLVVAATFLSCEVLARPPQRSIPVNDTFDLLTLRGKPPNYRKAYAQAGRLLGSWTLDFAGTGVDGTDLLRLADKTPKKEPFERALREAIRRPVDLHDFLLLLDDLLVASKKGLWGKRVYLLPGRVRSIGAMLHPDDAFKEDRPREYPHRKDELNIDPPRRRHDMPPAKDGDLLGPNWVFRFKNPIKREAKYAALAIANPSGTFTDRVRSLVNQLEEQGADVGLYTTVRNRHRGYLMWGSFALSRKKNRKQVIRFIRKLERYNHEWGLDVPIRWYHPGGWKATVEAARLMKDAYDVVYASRSGARKSKHYGGLAVDVTAVGLPRSLTLTASDGVQKIFDLSDPHQSRALNITPELVEWIERHFKLKKLKPDYPHWDDKAPADPARQAIAAARAREVKPSEGDGHENLAAGVAQIPSVAARVLPPGPLGRYWFYACIGFGALGLGLIGIGFTRPKR
jgi:hypothetical protein